MNFLNTRKLLNLAIVLTVFASTHLLADDTGDGVTTVVVTGQAQPTSTTDAPTNTSGSTPNSGYGGGPSAADLAAQKAAQKAGCESAIDSMYGNACFAQADAIHTDNKDLCNNIGIGAAVVAGISAVALQTSGDSKNSKVKLALLIGGGIGAAISGAVLSWASNSCKDTAEANFTYNKKACTDYVSNLKAQYCK